MSLINDALRRARQAQQTPPRTASADDGPAFRKPLPPPRPEPGVAWLPAISLAAVGVTALIIAWNWKVHHPSAPLEAHARTLSALRTTSQPAAGQDPRAPEPSTAGLARPAEAQTPAPPANAGAPPSPATASPPPPAEPTITPTISEAQATPVPAPPRLQSIIYHPQRPSAMIDGKVLFVGDKLRDLRVIAITPTGATIVSPSGTNHLEL